jgi:hypothetical protein
MVDFVKFVFYYNNFHKLYTVKDLVESFALDLAVKECVVVITHLI